MRVSRKIWVGLGMSACVAVAGASDSPAVADGVTPYPDAKGQPTVSFSRALGKMLDGEGGEGGIGLTASGPSFNFPALTTDQLRATLPGRTIRKDQAVAMYFDPSGTVEGWKRDWEKADASACPHEIGEDYEVEDGQCWIAKVNPISGAYRFDDGRVCMPAYSGKPEDGEACYYIGFLFKYIAIGDGKRMYGSGKEIYTGRHLDVFLRKPFGKIEK